MESRLENTKNIKKVKVLIITGDGVNCEYETKRAFEFAGAICDIVHINDLSNSLSGGEDFLEKHDILALPGGFSFGDELGSGKVFSLKLKSFLGERIQKFIEAKKPVIGICNGFQVLSKLGIFNDQDLLVGLAHNDHGKFINQWSSLKVEKSPCIWTTNIEELHLPVRHGEGRFVCRDKQDREGVDTLKKRGQVVLTYKENPNGSQQSVAGVCDPSGVVLGLMPHPEAAIKKQLYPGGVVSGSLGLCLFENAVKYCRSINKE